MQRGSLESSSSTVASRTFWILTRGYIRKRIYTPCFSRKKKGSFFLAKLLPLTLGARTIPKVKTSTPTLRRPAQIIPGQHTPILFPAQEHHREAGSIPPESVVARTSQELHHLSRVLGSLAGRRPSPLQGESTEPVHVCVRRVNGGYRFKPGSR